MSLFVQLLLLLLASACGGRGASGQSARELVLSRVMVDPVGLPDERGEWIEISNRGRTAADLRDWSLRSANDAGFVVRESVVLAPGTAVVVARSMDARLYPGAR